MKEMHNLEIKNNCFGELKHESQTDEIKRRDLPLLMLMVLKRNGEMKSRGVTNGSLQRMCADKAERTSQTPYFHSLKYVAAVAAEGERDTATVDLPRCFLQIEADDLDDVLIVKFAGAISLLLVESDEGRWKKHLHRENGKWFVCAKCDKVMHGTLNAVLMAR